MRVTVIETIEHSAEITPEMVVAFALRNGWKIDVKSGNSIDIDRGDGSADMTIWNSGAFLHYRVVDIATSLGRKPHEVLYDIARGT